MASFFAVELLLKIVGLVGPNLKWLLNCTFLTAYEPQRLVADQRFAWTFFVPLPDDHWTWGGLSYHSLLLGLGVLCYTLAMAHFCRRDLPAPL
jgi:ABC-2 type transport system permease protein